jgi:hypothetical protein
MNDRKDNADPRLQLLEIVSAPPILALDLTLIPEPSDRKSITDVFELTRADCVIDRADPYRKYDRTLKVDPRATMSTAESLDPAVTQDLKLMEEPK